MYVWMIIATFIVMLAAFNLAPRSDLKSEQQVPLAEAAITKFLVQHRAAVKYAKEEFIKQMNTGEVTLNNGANTLTVCNSNKVGKLCKYLPIGYTHSENEFYSKIYCLNENVYTSGSGTMRIRTKIAGVETASCKTSGESVRYVITYGRVPERWKNVATNKILGDFYAALQRKVPSGASSGVVIKRRGDVDIEKNPLESEYVISGIDVHNESIPKYFLDNDTEFKQKCSKDIDGNILVLFISYRCKGV